MGYTVFASRIFSGGGKSSKSFPGEILPLRDNVSGFIVYHLSLLGIYTDSPESIPPKIILFGVLPALITIVILFATRKGSLFIDRLSMQMLTYVHITRIPVELVLYGVFLNGTVYFYCSAGAVCSPGSY